VDDEDYEYLSQFNWKNKKGYAVRTVFIDRVRQYEITMSRELMGLDANNALQVDHINRNTLDNRKCNLRICTNAENAMNRGVPKNNTSGYKGVTWIARNNRWRSLIIINRKRKYLGYFESKIDAAIAYDIAALSHRGEFAYLNFPQMRGCYQIEI